MCARSHVSGRACCDAGSASTDACTPSSTTMATTSATPSGVPRRGAPHARPPHACSSERGRRAPALRGARFWCGAA
eukprot:2065880-Prymnesium_polylepis.1